jgi:hypothetical protein
LDDYREPIKKQGRNDFPARISSDNIDSAIAQKNSVLMFRKYISFLERY